MVYRIDFKINEIADFILIYGETEDICKSKMEKILSRKTIDKDSLVLTKFNNFSEI